MCANHRDSYGAASGKNRGPSFYFLNALYSVRPLVYIRRALYSVHPLFRFRRVRSSGGPLINLRRPLFFVLAGLTASLWITLLLPPRGPADYEPYRNRRVCLTGTVAGLEPALENDEVIWRMTLADVEMEPMGISSVRRDAHVGLENGMEEKEKTGSAVTAGSDEIFPESSEAAGSGSGSIPLERRARVLCVLDCRPDLDMSARVRVRGSLFPFRFARNEGEFDSRLYYHILRTAFSLRDVRIEASSGPTDHLAAFLYRLKRHLETVIDLVFPDRTALVLQAILLGGEGSAGK